jgi:gas vesicle protein
MNKIFSFLAGSLCGALIGGTAALLFAPTSGDQLRADAHARWEQALQEAQEAMEETRRELEAQFEQMKKPAQ